MVRSFALSVDRSRESLSLVFEVGQRGGPKPAFFSYSISASPFSGEQDREPKGQRKKERLHRQEKIFIGKAS